MSDNCPICRMQHEPVPDIEQMIADLKAHGWVPERATRWRAPNGELFIGPAGAWRHLKRWLAQGGQEGAPK